MEIIRLAHAEMPEEYRPKLGDDSKTSLSFPDLNSKIFTSLEIRSTGLHNLHISEWCFIKDQRILSTLGAINEQTTNITGETTGNGIGNHGYEVYTDASGKHNETGYRADFFPWYLQEEYRVPLNGITEVKKTTEEGKFISFVKRSSGQIIDDEQILWRRAMKRKLQGLFKQEHPETDEDAFLMTGNKYFNSMKIKALMTEARLWSRENRPFKETDDEIWWEKPKSRCFYVAGADTSEGSNDYSVIKVINVTERKEAARYRARVGIDYFYRVCDRIGRAFNTAFLAVERNNHGHAVLLGLREDCKYPSLFWEDKDKRIVGSLTHTKERKYGWNTTKTSKMLMLDQLRQFVEGDSSEDEEHFQPEITWYDQVLLDECLTMEEDEGKVNSISGKHDDTVIATAIAMQLYARTRKRIFKGESLEQDGILLGASRETVL